MIAKLAFCCTCNDLRTRRSFMIQGHTSSIAKHNGKNSQRVLIDLLMVAAAHSLFLEHKYSIKVAKGCHVQTYTFS